MHTACLRDGVTIYVDVFRPVGVGVERVPVIVAWSPYGKSQGTAPSVTSLFGMLGMDNTALSGLEKCLRYKVFMSTDVHERWAKKHPRKTWPSNTTPKRIRHWCRLQSASPRKRRWSAIRGRGCGSSPGDLTIWTCSCLSRNWIVTGHRRSSSTCLITVR